MSADMKSSFLIYWSGVLLWAYFLVKIFFSLYRFFELHIWSRYCEQIDLKAYGKWAVVTGATDGIGKAYAIELAKRGMDIILISRNKIKLEQTASEIEKLYGVKTFQIQADYSQRDCYSHIKRKLDDIEIGILVNNVGILHPTWVEYNQVEEAFLWKEININCAATAIMTRLVLPKMKKRRKGLIVNISSISSFTSFPKMSLYAATKCFINMFSFSIGAEVSPYNIRVQNLIPYFVDTNLILGVEDTIRNIKKIGNFFIPDAKTFAKSAVYTLNTKYHMTTGYWSHSLLELLIEFLPSKLTEKIVHAMFDFLRKNSTK